MKVLGAVTWTNFDKAGSQIAGVLPLYEVQKSDWRAVKASEEFPSQGQVFWPHAQGAFEGQLLFFKAEPNIGQKDEFRVVDPRPAFEVLDVRHLGGPTDVRAALVAGLHWNGPASGRTFLWCKENVLVGPVEVVRSPGGILKLGGANLARITTYGAGDPKRLLVESKERLVRIDETSPTGYVDWDDDATVLRRAVEVAVRIAKQAGRDTGTTKRQIDEAARALSEQGIGIDAKLDLYRLERAKALCASTHLVNQASSDVVETLKGLPKIADALAKAESAVRADVQARATAEIGQQLSAERERLQLAKDERERVLAALAENLQEIEAAKQQLLNLKGEIDARAADIEAAIEARIRAAIERPAALLAEVSVLRPLLSSSDGSPDAVPGAKSPGTAKPKWGALNETIKDRAMLSRVLTSAARSYGLAPAVMMRVHASLAAQLMPVAEGTSGMAAFAAYAAAACGSRISTLHMRADCLHPDDLIDPKWGSGSGCSANFSAVSAAAEGVDGVSILVIEGANRAPLEASVVPLLQLRSTGLGAQTPTGLRIAATLVAGATTVPVSPQIWAYSVAVLSDPATPQNGAIEKADLRLGSDLFAIGDIPKGPIQSLLEVWPDCADLLHALERYGAALSRVYGDDERVRSALLEGLVLPYAVSSSPPEELDERLGAGGKDLEAATAVVRRLRRVLL